MNATTRHSLLLIILFLSTFAVALAQTDQNAAQLRKQIEDLKCNGESYTNWSPDVRKAYDRALESLARAYNKAAEIESKQLKEFLGVVTEPGARKHILDQIAQMQSFSPRTASSTDPKTTASKTGQTPANVNGSGSGANDKNDEIKTYSVKVYARVKGTGYPVSGAYVQLLKLYTDGDTPEFRPTSGFSCPDKNKRCNTLESEPLLIEFPASKGIYKVAVQKDRYHTFVQPDEIAFDKDGQAIVNAVLTPRDDEFYRAVLGFEQTGISAGSSQQNLFMNLFISIPILKDTYYSGCINSSDDKSSDDKCPRPKHRLWGDIRVTSVPQPKQNLFQALNGSFANTVNGGIGQIGDLTAGFSFLAGYQYKLPPGSLAGNRFDFSLIAGGGAAAVLSPEKNGQIYKIPDSKDRERRIALERKLLNEAAFDPAKLTGYQNIAFVTKERDRFLRSYYGGFRFETHYGDFAPQRVTGMFDVLFGQDEAVTGGRLRGSVLRLDGFFPLPVGKGNLVYLFGTAQLGLKRSKTNDPVLLPIADTTQTLTSPDTLVVPVPAANRDIYRIGVGVSLLQVFSSNKNK